MVIQSHQKERNVPVPPSSCQHIISSVFFNLSHSDKSVMMFLIHQSFNLSHSNKSVMIFLIYTSLMTNDVEHLFMCLFACLEKHRFIYFVWFICLFLIVSGENINSIL